MAFFYSSNRKLKHTCIVRNVYQSHLSGYLWGEKNGRADRGRKEVIEQNKRDGLYIHENTML